MSGGLPPAPHHTRMYLLLGTLLIGGILFLLFMNEKEQGFSLTSAVIGQLRNDSGDVPFAEDQQLDDIKSSRKAIDVILSFDRVPPVDQDMKAAVLEFHFADLAKRITVNKDVLEVNNAGSIVLRLEDYAGRLGFDAADASLDGTARRIEVNGVAFSSKDGLSISFPAMGYESLSLQNAELESLEFPAGNGQLSVAEKLSYQLSNDKVSLYSFIGEMGIRTVNESVVHLEGTVKGVRAGGELDLRVQ